MCVCVSVFVCGVCVCVCVCVCVSVWCGVCVCVCVCVAHPFILLLCCWNLLAQPLFSFPTCMRARVRICVQSRPFGVALLFAGLDKHGGKVTPQLYVQPMKGDDNMEVMAARK